MLLSPKIINLLTTAAAKALATHGPAGLNVVPVSMIKVTPGEIWLFDFFMDKTVQNINENSSVSLTAWTDMIGVQVRAEASYIVNGNKFTEATAWVHTQNPDRILRGLLVLKPITLFDISPGGHFDTADLMV